MQPSHAAILLLAFACGCHGGVFAKRQSEENCPTDIRKTVPCYPGEDAVFACPCGPSGNFYGHRPTCWRTWPAPAEAWRDAYCGSGYGAAVIEHSSSTYNPFTSPETIMSVPEPTPAPAPGNGVLEPKALPTPAAPPATTPPAAPPAFPGLPPLPGRTTEAKRPGPKFVAAKSGKRSPTSVQQKAAAVEAKATETQAMYDAVSAPQGQEESEEQRQLVQPATLEAPNAGQSEMRLIASELLEPDDAALATFEASVPAEADNSASAAPTAPVAPSAGSAQSPPRPRPCVTGFVR